MKTYKLIFALLLPQIFCLLVPQTIFAQTEKLDIVEDIVPLHDVPMSLKLASAPKSVYLAPERSPLKFEYANGRASVTVPRVNGHAMVVFE